MLERILRHRKPAEREAPKLLAGPAAFDRELFVALNQHFGTGYPPTSFEDLCGLSIIEPGADGRLRLHGLMREHLLAALDWFWQRQRVFYDAARYAYMRALIGTTLGEPRPAAYQTDAP